MTADRHEAAVRPAGKSAREPDVDERFDGVDAVRVLRESHRPDEDRVRTIDQQPGKCLDPLAWSAALPLDLRPLDRLGLHARSVESDRVFAYEAFVDPAECEERTEHADEKREVAAGVHVEPMVGDRSPAQRALRDRRNPVAFEPGLAVGIDDRDLRAVLLGVVQVFHRDRLVVRDVRPEQDDQVGVEPVDVAAGRGAIPERRLHRRRRCGVAEARGIVDVIGAEEPRRLLRGVVDLVGDAARRQIERQPIRVDAAKLAGQIGPALRPR